MINKLTGRPTKVHCTGDILVSLDQMKDVVHLFDKNRIKFKMVNYEEKTGENKSLATMLELVHGTDIVDAQRILDRIP